LYKRQQLHLVQLFPQVVAMLLAQVAQIESQENLR
jgi:hypothetical protein